MWLIDENAQDEMTVITGPVGDTVILYLEPDPYNPPDEVSWTDWTFTGTIRDALGGTEIVALDMTDNSTADVLDVQGRADSSGWTPGTDLYVAIIGTDGSDTVTFVEAILRPYQGVI